MSSGEFSSSSKPVDQRVKFLKSQKDRQIRTWTLPEKKAVEQKDESDNNCSGWHRNIPQRPGKKKTRTDHWIKVKEYKSIDKYKLKTRTYKTRNNKTNIIFKRMDQNQCLDRAKKKPNSPLWLLLSNSYSDDYKERYN